MKKANEYKYQIDGGPYVLLDHEDDCLFCEHCEEFLWDWSEGPYMFFCEKKLNGDCVRHGCPDFKYDGCSMEVLEYEIEET